MVNDPRVTTLLSRLGGLYRDPARVDRDASSLLKSSVGVHLVRLSVRVLPEELFPSLSLLFRFLVCSYREERTLVTDVSGQTEKYFFRFISSSVIFF